MNEVKNLIQKEEFIALAINRYILQNASIPKQADSQNLDWPKLLTSEYLGTNFDRSNHITSTDINVEFDSNNNNAIIKSFNLTQAQIDANRFAYNFYINKIYRINTISPQNITNEVLNKGTKIIYPSLQQKIVSYLKDGETILFPDENCTKDEYFYQLRDNKLTKMYCKKTNKAIIIYQKSPIYLEDLEDLNYVKSDIGASAYVQKNGAWYEYYFQGETKPSWMPVANGSVLNVIDSTLTKEDRILGYIPKSKDLVLKKDGGCMLANGDIFCWGNNLNKKAGIENYGQLDTTISADYINTPVMLKVQILDEGRKNNHWYNNPYRVKFEKMAMNNTNVCGISPIFDYIEDGEHIKFGGDLFCNGVLKFGEFEDLGILSGETTTSILKRNSYIYTGKSDEKKDGDEIYLVDILMNEGIWIALSDEGKIYSVGTNKKGALGIENSNETFSTRKPQLINKEGQVFKSIYALRDIKGFGALDTQGYFWYWGEKSDGKFYTVPTKVDSGLIFDEEKIFSNSKNFVLKSLNGGYYRTYINNDNLDLKEVLDGTTSLDTALSVSVYDIEDKELLLYIDKEGVLRGSSELLSCQNSCTSSQNSIFNNVLPTLNSDISNISIYEGIGEVTTTTTIENVFFNNYNSYTYPTSPVGWKNSMNEDRKNIMYYDTRYSYFIGRLGYYLNSEVDRKLKNDGSEDFKKTFSFPSYSDNEVEIRFTFYEIDNWDDANKFYVYLNGQKVYTGNYHYTDNGRNYNYFWVDYNEGTNVYTSTVNNIPVELTHYASENLGLSFEDTQLLHEEKHEFKIVTRLDSKGEVTLGFGMKTGSSTVDDFDNISFGIDNIKIDVKKVEEDSTIRINDLYMCGIKGNNIKSQLYCWGNVGRSLPLLSTSLYDVSKITTLNKLFISSQNEKSNQMSFDDFNKNGNLFLRYPTYISGFDYPFYFK